MGLPPASVFEQVDRILSSRGFRHAERMRRFLTVAVEAALRGETPKELVVGATVFDRRPDYDTRVDPIVRVEARRLRAKLEEYYADAGSGDEIVIEIPKGSYTAVVRRRDARAPAPATASIAVLPFANLSRDSEEDYFSDGLTEELIHRLTRIPELRVLAWPSASRLRGRDEDVGGIRDQLNVDLVLRGSVRRGGGQIRITAQLVDTASGEFRWSESYSRSVSDLLVIQEEIAGAIVSTLKLSLRATGRPAAANAEAHHLCLRARYLAGRRTLEAIRKSLACYEQAAAIDPRDATVWAGIADTHILLAEYGDAPPASTLERARQAALRALDLDPYSAEAHTSLAGIRTYLEWNWSEAEALYQRAIDLNPGYARTRHWYGGDYLAPLGRWDEAEAQLDAAHRLDPLSAIILEGAAYVRVFRREYDRALTELGSILDLEPSFYKAYTAMGRIYSLQGRYRDALEMFRRGRSSGGDVPSILAATGQVHALLGERDQAIEYLEMLQRLSRERYVPLTGMAIIHLGLGDHAAALSLLERAAEQRESSIAFTRVHPLYDPLRGEPRFQNLLKQTGLLP